MTRDTEIRTKLTVTRGEVGGGNAGVREGHQGPRIKDPRTQPKGGGRRAGRSGGEKMSNVELDLM